MLRHFFFWFIILCEFWRKGSARGRRRRGKREGESRSRRGSRLINRVTKANGIGGIVRRYTRFAKQILGKETDGAGFGEGSVVLVSKNR